MKRLITSLTRAERRGLHLQLEQWLVAARARTATVLPCPLPQRCRCRRAEGVRSGALRARTVEGDCSILHACQILDSAGAGETSHLLCLRYRARSGSACILQLGVSQPPPEALNLISLAGPLLMWIASLQQTRSLTESLGRARAAYDVEMEWIGLEVHDRIAQTLASVFHQFQAIEGLSSSYPEIHRAVARGSLLCREAIREARTIMDDLRPPILDELGLLPAMQGDLRRLAEKPRCRVGHVMSLKRRLPRAGELTLYRIFREALLNIQKHARPTRVDVALREAGGGVRLDVSDNGVGCDVQTAMAKRRVGGLFSMRRRAEMAGGVWRIESSPGDGTTVSAWLPLSPTAAPFPSLIQQAGALPAGGSRS